MGLHLPAEEVFVDFQLVGAPQSILHLAAPCSTSRLAPDRTQSAYPARDPLPPLVDVEVEELEDPGLSRP